MLWKTFDKLQLVSLVLFILNIIKASGLQKKREVYLELAYTLHSSRLGVFYLFQPKSYIFLTSP